MLPITFPNNFTFFLYIFKLGKQEFTFKYIKTGIKPKMTPIIIGDGTKIINQYPLDGTKLNIGSKVFILTNGTNYTMPDITNWSRSEVETFAKLIKLDVLFDGYGYVTKYNFEKNSKIDLSKSLSVTLEKKYEEKEEDKTTIKKGS